MLYFLRRNSLQLGNFFDHCWKDQGCIPRSAQEFRWQYILAIGQNKGCICFNQNLVQRNMFYSFPQISGPLFLLQDGTANTEVITKLQILLGYLPGTIEAVNDTTKLSSRVEPKNPQRILVGIPDMAI